MGFLLVSPLTTSSLTLAVTRGRIISIFLIISGSVLYVYAKTEGEKKPPPTSASADSKALERGTEEVVFEQEMEKEREEV